MKVVRWPECDVLESELKLIDEFWIKTNVGPIMAAFIFPIGELEKLLDLKDRVNKKKKELSDVEAEIYKISRKFK